MSDPLRSKLESRRTDDCPPDMSSVWEELLETDDRERYKMDINVLHAAVKKGNASFIMLSVVFVWNSKYLSCS